MPGKCYFHWQLPLPVPHFRHSNEFQSLSHISFMQHQHLLKTFDAIEALFYSLSTVTRIKVLAVWASVLLVSDHVANLVNRCYDKSVTVLISNYADRVFLGHQSTLGHCTATFLKSLTNHGIRETGWNKNNDALLLASTAEAVSAKCFIVSICIKSNFEWTVHSSVSRLIRHLSMIKMPHYKTYLSLKW